MYDSNWTLNTSHVLIERDMANIFNEKFPNYEILWSKYLIPLIGTDGSWRHNTHPSLEEIGLSQFGIFKNLTFIEYSKPKISVGDKKQSYKNIYFHFGLIFDTVNNFSRNICIIENELGISKLGKKLKISTYKMIYNYWKWIIKNYEKKFYEMVEKGKPIFYYPQHNQNFISNLIPKKLRKEYFELEKNIKKYRNFYSHTPGVDIIKDLSTNELYAIKKEHVDECKYWSSLRNLFLEHNECFDNPKEIVQKDFSDTLDILNRLWEFFIEKMKQIYCHDNFEKIFQNFNRNEIE